MTVPGRVGKGASGVGAEETPDQGASLPGDLHRDRNGRRPPRCSPMLTRILYISAIADGVSDIDVQIILGVSQVNNRRLDITGMLVQSHGHFVQLLEGRSSVVRDLMGKIAADPLHRDLRLLHDQPIERRQFSRWAMGLVRSDDLTETTNRLHRDGCESAAEMRRLIERLMASADW